MHNLNYRNLRDVNLWKDNDMNKTRKYTVGGSITEPRLPDVVRVCDDCTLLVRSLLVESISLGTESFPALIRH